MSGGTFAFTKSGPGVLSTSLRIGALNVSGGTVKLLPAPAALGGSRIGPLAISSGAKLDVSAESFATSSPVGLAIGGIYDGVTGLIQQGYGPAGDGLWDGSSGIVTSEPAATTHGYTSIGVASAQQVKHLSSTTQTAVWSGQTVSGGDTLVKYTYGGDANLDGTLNIDDYTRIDQGIESGLSGWFNGDFNYDGKVNVDDYVILDANILTQGSPLASASGSVTSTARVTPVPEPLLGSVLGVLCASHRVARRCQRAR